MHAYPAPLLKYDSFFLKWLWTVPTWWQQPEQDTSHHQHVLDKHGVTARRRIPVNNDQAIHYHISPIMQEQLFLCTAVGWSTKGKIVITKCWLCWVEIAQLLLHVVTYHSIHYAALGLWRCEPVSRAIALPQQQAAMLFTRAFLIALFIDDYFASYTGWMEMILWTSWIWVCMQIYIWKHVYRRRAKHNCTWFLPESTEM